MSVITRVRREGTADEITYEEADGFEVFTYQIVSLGLDDSPLLLDFAGRVVQNNDDMEDIKVTVVKHPVHIQEESSSLAQSAPAESSTSDQRHLSSIPAVCTHTVAADLWCIDNSLANVGEYCSRMFLQVDQRTNTQPNTNNECDVLQPVYRIVDTNIHLCSRCQLFFDPSLIVADRTVLHAFTCESDKAMEMGLASTEASECLLR